MAQRLLPVPMASIPKFSFHLYLTQLPAACLQNHYRALLIPDPPPPRTCSQLPPSHIRNTYSQGEKTPPRMLCCPGWWAGEARGQSVSAPGHRVSQELPFPTGYLSVSSGCPTLTRAAGKNKEGHTRLLGATGPGCVVTAPEPWGKGWGETNLAAPSEHQDTLSPRTRTLRSR